jgi:hypothetical protein
VIPQFKKTAAVEYRHLENRHLIQPVRKLNSKMNLVENSKTLIRRIPI